MNRTRETNLGGQACEIAKPITEWYTRGHDRGTRTDNWNGRFAYETSPRNLVLV